MVYIVMPFRDAICGIKRALEKWPAIDFADDHEGCLFTKSMKKASGNWNRISKIWSRPG
jgi:ATP-dependent DNA helicase RecG